MVVAKVPAARVPAAVAAREAKEAKAPVAPRWGVGPSWQPSLQQAAVQQPRLRRLMTNIRKPAM